MNVGTAMVERVFRSFGDVLMDRHVAVKSKKEVVPLTHQLVYQSMRCSVTNKDT